MQAFAVLASDGSIHTWGDANFGGTTVAVDPLPKAVALYSTQVTQGYHRLQCIGVAACNAWGWGVHWCSTLLPRASRTAYSLTTYLLTTHLLTTHYSLLTICYLFTVRLRRTPRGRRRRRMGRRQQRWPHPAREGE